ncbi:hypothetical protein B0H14DRAFT_2630957 [Mycena olivaceomarginata]|nr:hypothetical protein B0H14DRAFT_2630957 [Mycena olivaceomarginata]
MWDPEKATMTQLRAYRNCAYMNMVNATYDEYRTQNSTPFSSRAPFRAGSALGSRASSSANSVFSLAGSRPSSRASFIPPSRALSSRASSPLDKDVIVISDSDSEGFPGTVSAPLVVHKIEPLPAPPPLNPSSDLPRVKKGAMANRKQLRARFNSPVGNRTLTIDRYLRKEAELLELQDQESWGGSGGHSNGDAMSLCSFLVEQRP